MAGNNDLQAAEKTYGSFIGMVKWGSIAVAVIVAFVVFLLTRGQ